MLTAMLSYPRRQKIAIVLVTQVTKSQEKDGNNKTCKELSEHCTTTQLKD